MYFIKLCMQSYLNVFLIGDLIMCILFYNDHQEHELEYKEKIHLILLFILYGLIYIFDVHFKCMVCTNAAQDFFIFCV